MPIKKPAAEVDVQVAKRALAGADTEAAARVLVRGVGLGLMQAHRRLKKMTAEARGEIAALDGQDDFGPALGKILAESEIPPAADANELPITP